MIETKSKNKPFKAGMYLLETLTSGMYNDPLSIYREYIQNAADSIDTIGYLGNDITKKINVDLDPFKRSITILDEGAGIPADESEKVLSGVGLSSKANSNLRGFRGIGRLGGLAFCDSAVFKTKFNGENVESIQEWDCTKLRSLMAGLNGKTYSLRQLFNICTIFYHKNGKNKSGSYFKVELAGVQSFRNQIMDIKKVYDFISVNAPVPFNQSVFKYSTELSNYLSSKVPNFNEYEITLNGETVYKPYADSVKLTSKGFDEIEGIQYFDIEVNEAIVAYGWYGKRKDLLGAITKGQLASGLRVRIGNIQIGEVHVISKDLIPNSRRDDFIDNEAKGLFYNEIERKLGLPITRQIRLQSRIREKGHREESVNIQPPDKMKNLENHSIKDDVKSGSDQNDKGQTPIPLHSDCLKCPVFNSLCHGTRE